MSVSYSTSVICGFILTIEERTKSVTKYDQDTGKPYSQTIPDTPRALIDDIDIGDFHEIYNEDGMDGLSMITGGDFEHYCLGVEVSEFGFDYDKVHVRQFDTTIPEPVKLFADKLGISPRWIHSSYVA